MKIAVLLFLVNIGLVASIPKFEFRFKQQKDDTDNESSEPLPFTDLQLAVNQLLSFEEVQSIIKVVKTINPLECEGSKQILDYLNGPDFKKIHIYLWQDKEFLDILSYLADSGFPHIYDAFNEIYKILGIPYRVGPTGPLDSTDVIPTMPDVDLFGKKGCNTEEVIAAVTVAASNSDIAMQALQLLNSDPGVKSLLAKLSEPAKGEAYKKFLALDEVKTLLELARKAGPETDNFLTVIETFFHWN